MRKRKVILEETSGPSVLSAVWERTAALQITLHRNHAKDTDT